MATARDKVTIAAEVPIHLKAELEKRAKAEGRSVSRVIWRACRFYLDYAALEKAGEERPRLKGESEKRDG